MHRSAFACLAFITILTLAKSLPNGVHLPLHLGSRARWKRDGGSSEAGLGDASDVTYNVLVRVGQTLTPLILDTGSADLWLVSDGCRELCAHTDLPLYPQAALSPIGQSVHLLYGDSHTSTHAFGPIGTDTVGIAELSVPRQYLAAITDTNTSVLDTGSAGILGLGFAPISLIWRQLMADKGSSLPLALPGRVADAVDTAGLNLRTHTFPSFSSLARPSPYKKRQNPRYLMSWDTDSITTYGPLLTRLATLGVLSRPLVATTLQRDTVSLGDHAGTLSLGALPDGISEDDLTWVPVRGYRASQGGLPPSPQAPYEIYPLVWEVPLDDVFFDGIRLPRSSLSPPSISLSALVDTGNSLIRGPRDVLTHIAARLGDTFDCAIPHNLSFLIGGVLFPVDPRDFARPESLINDIVGLNFGPARAQRCTPALAVTDPPGDGGFLYSWSLGVPFLKSTLAAFYYGNSTHPTRDPPRVGFLSTVPSDAGESLADAVASAALHGGLFPEKSDLAIFDLATGIGPIATQGLLGVF
ncbi:acid protease [Epithele typhae]|uniref:acid protease n=1 Tax=Epithele typhae TaxID=378194 RepID=UPI002008CF8B|nr:acid protease [Epithele typhae]KAH9913688.1 acid protease [Epithele typhae]